MNVQPTPTPATWMRDKVRWDRRRRVGLPRDDEEDEDEAEEEEYDEEEADEEDQEAL